MTALYSFFVRKDRNPRMSYAPWYVTCVSSDCPRIERVVVTGCETEEEAQQLADDLLAAIENDRMRESAAIHTVELPEPLRVVRFDSIGRVVQSDTLRRNGRGKWMPHQRRWRDPQRGQALVEFALCLTALLLILLGMLDLGICEMDKQNVSYIAEGAANCAAQVPAGSCDPVAYITNSEAGLSLVPAQLTYTISGNTVTVNYSYMPLGPVWPSGVVLTATATGVNP
jgi:hypothetical protein